MRHILLVEDDKTLGLTLQERLTKEGFSVSWATNALTTRSFLKKQNFDLIIFDVGLPDISGFDLAKEVRDQNLAPFIFVTAQGQAQDRLQGYELGAEEFIPKPFHLKELLMRVHHVLEKHMPPHALEVDSNTIIDFTSRTVRRGDKIQHLNAKEYAVLRLLVESSPKVLSRDEILNQVWGEDEFPSNRTIDNVILSIRQQLGESASHCIRAVRGVGYQWLLKDEVQTK